MEIPKWFWQILLGSSIAGSAITVYLMATGAQERSYIWYLFLFLMAVWFALRQLRKSS